MRACIPNLKNYLHKQKPPLAKVKITKGQTMDKKISSIILLIFLMIFSSLTVSAHSGKTDSNGGHHDSSSGEYHYHHGYPAHQHYDIDKDGDIDCPYEFKDKTNHGSSGGYTQNTNNSQYYNSSSSIPEFLFIAPWIIILASVVWILVLIKKHSAFSGVINHVKPGEQQFAFFLGVVKPLCKN